MKIKATSHGNHLWDYLKILQVCHVYDILPLIICIITCLSYCFQKTWKVSYMFKSDSSLLKPTSKHCFLSFLAHFRILICFLMDPDKPGWSWTDLDGPGQTWMDQDRPRWIRTDPGGSRWTRTDQGSWTIIVNITKHIIEKLIFSNYFEIFQKVYYIF